MTRDRARLLGYKRFLGNPCRVCGSRERYVREPICIRCHHKANKRAALVRGGALYAKEYAAKYYRENKARIYAQHERYRLANMDRFLANARRKRGLPNPTRPTPLVCECCGKPPGKVALNLDHDHVTHKFRGWLCHLCNTAIGKLGDDIAGLQRAIDYLIRAELQ